MNIGFLNTKNISLITLLTFALLYCVSSHAQNEGRWYNVEVLIFKRLGIERSTNENWPQDIKLLHPENIQHLQARNANNFLLLQKNQHQLGGLNYVLRKGEDYRVLYHKAWRQQMLSAKTSPSIVISGGETIHHSKDYGVNDMNNKELKGYIKIHIARYLHLTTDLWLSGDIPTKNTRDNLGNSKADNIDQSLKAQSTTAEREQKTQELGHNAYFDSRYTNSKPVSVLREKRRMRSKELHYIDHPLMGLLILITPISQ